MSNCFSSFPTSPFPGSNYYFAPTPQPPTRTSVPNLHTPIPPTMSGAIPTMSAHSFSHSEPDGFFVHQHHHHHHHPGAQFHHHATPTRGSATVFMTPNGMFTAAADEPTQQPYAYYPSNVAQYLHYQRMQHLSRAQYLHNQSINNLISNIYAYRRSQAYAAANAAERQREQNNQNKNNKESDSNNTNNNNVIITEVTDDEDDYEIDGKKCIDKKDYVDAISIDGEETLV